MNIREIQAIAQSRGIKAGKMRKADLIRIIEEGNSDCFESEKRLNCDQGPLPLARRLRNFDIKKDTIL